MGMRRFGETVGSADVFMSSGITLMTEDVKTRFQQAVKILLLFVSVQTVCRLLCSDRNPSDLVSKVQNRHVTKTVR